MDRKENGEGHLLLNCNTQTPNLTPDTDTVDRREMVSACRSPWSMPLQHAAVCSCEQTKSWHNKQTQSLDLFPRIQTLQLGLQPQKRLRKGDSQICCFALENLLWVQEPRFSSEFHHDSGPFAASLTNKSTEAWRCQSS
jgi:hypothetical protein